MILNNHIYVRHVLRGRTPETISGLMMDAGCVQAYDAMRTAGWMEVTEQQAAMPRHNFVQVGHEDKFDAYCFIGSYAAGFAHLYAGAVCYAVQIPADAREGTACTISAVTVQGYGDRYLAQGAILCAIPSTSPLPPTWAEVLAATAATAAEMIVVPSNTGTDTSETLSITISPAVNAHSYNYLHLVLRIADYTAHRAGWYEGGAMIDGSTLAVTYSRDVFADDLDECPVLAVPRTVVNPDGTMLTSAGWDQAWRSAGIVDVNEPADVAAQAAVWATAFGMFPSAEMETLMPATLGGDHPLGAFLQLDAERRAGCHASCRFLAIGQTDGRTMTKLTFDRAIPAPYAYTRVRLAVYAITDLAATAVIGAIDAATFADPAFWEGTAAVVGVGGVSRACTPLVRMTVRSAIAEDTVFPITYTSSRPGMLLLVMSLTRMCSSPGFTVGVRYGLTFAPDIINLTE